MQQFLSFPIGGSFENDKYTVVFVWSFLWVLRAEKVLLLQFVRLLMSMIQNASNAYK